MKASGMRACIIILIVIVTASFLFLLFGIILKKPSEEPLQSEATPAPTESVSKESESETDGNVLKINPRLSPHLNTEPYPVEETLTIVFDNTDVVDYSYTTEGLTAIEKDANSMQFEIVAIDEFGSLDVYADYGDGELVKSSVYTYQKDGLVCASNVSKDTAFYHYMEDLYNRGLITMAEWENAYSDISRRYFIAQDDVPEETGVENVE